MTPVITIWNAKDVPDLWNDLIASWFWREFNWPMERIAPMDWRVLVTAGEDLIGHIGLLRRTVHVGEQSVLVGGVGEGSHFDQHGRHVGAPKHEQGSGIRAAVHRRHGRLQAFP